jgi:hypothetical protein
VSDERSAEVFYLVQTYLPGTTPLYKVQSLAILIDQAIQNAYEAEHERLKTQEKDCPKGD